jgi:hypothetical protein
MTTKEQPDMVLIDRARFERMRRFIIDVHHWSWINAAERNILHDGDTDPLPKHHDATIKTASASTIPLGSTPTLTSDRSKTSATSE